MEKVEEKFEKIVVRELMNLIKSSKSSGEVQFYANKKFRNKLAYQAIKSNDLDQALAHAMDSVDMLSSKKKVKPKHRSQLYYNLGVVHFLRADYDKAREALMIASDAKSDKTIEELLVINSNAIDQEDEYIHWQRNAALVVDASTRLPGKPVLSIYRDIPAEPVNDDDGACLLSSLDSSNGNALRLSYDDGQLTRMSIKRKARENGVELEVERKVEYLYRYDGKIASMSTERGDMLYKYNSFGQLIGIDTEIHHPSTFELDAVGRIVLMMNRNSVYRYRYSNGNPTKIVVIDNKGNVIEEIDVKYDNKPNILANVGPLGNPLAMSLGYPMGETINNLVLIKRTFLNDARWSKHKAGDVTEHRPKYTYNDKGYITSSISAVSDLETNYRYIFL